MFSICEVFVVPWYVYLLLAFICDPPGKGENIPCARRAEPFCNPRPTKAPLESKRAIGSNRHTNPPMNLQPKNEVESGRIPFNNQLGPLVASVGTVGGAWGNVINGPSVLMATTHGGTSFNALPVAIVREHVSVMNESQPRNLHSLPEGMSRPRGRPPAAGYRSVPGESTAPDSHAVGPNPGQGSAQGKAKALNVPDVSTLERIPRTIVNLKQAFIGATLVPGSNLELWILRDDASFFVTVVIKQYFFTISVAVGLSCKNAPDLLSFVCRLQAGTSPMLRKLCFT